MARKAQPVSGVYEKNEGSGIWYIRYRTHGKLVRKKVGTRAQAIDHLAKVKYVRASGDGIVPSTAKRSVRTSAEVVADQEGVLLGELCDGLLNQIIGNPERYRDQVNPPPRIARIQGALGGRIASSIRPWEINDWLDSLKVAPATFNRYKTQFSAVYEWGKERDKVAVNPVRDVKQRTPPDTVIRWLDATEEARLRKVLHEDVDACSPRQPRRRQRLQHHIYELDVAVGTGMRLGEQYSLTWDQVNFRRREIILTKTKNGSERIIYLNDDVVAALRGLQQIPMERRHTPGDELVEPLENYVFSLSSPKEWFKGALKRADIKDFRWHDGRHTFCSRLSQQKVDLKAIQVLAGHKTIQTTANYAHLDKKTMTDAVALLTKEHAQA